MTNNDLVSTISARLDDVDQEEFSTGVILRELRIAVVELGHDPLIRHVLFPSESTSISLVSGTAEYTLPTDNANWIERVEYKYTDTANNRELRYVSRDEIFNQQEELGGEVQYYTIRGTKIVFAGIPDSDDAGVGVKIWYSARPTEASVALDDNETTLSRHFPELLVARVCSRLVMTDPDLAGLHDRLKNEYDECFRRAIESLEEQGTQGPRYF